MRSLSGGGSWRKSARLNSWWTMTCGLSTGAGRTLVTMPKSARSQRSSCHVDGREADVAEMDAELGPDLPREAGEALVVVGHRRHDDVGRVGARLLEGDEVGPAVVARRRSAARSGRRATAGGTAWRPRPRGRAARSSSSPARTSPCPSGAGASSRAGRTGVRATPRGRGGGSRRGASCQRPDACGTRPTGTSTARTAARLAQRSHSVYRRHVSHQRWLWPTLALARGLMTGTPATARRWCRCRTARPPAGAGRGSMS